jgi:hypothetical protein
MSRCDALLALLSGASAPRNARRTAYPGGPDLVVGNQATQTLYVSVSSALFVNDDGRRKRKRGESSTDVKVAERL